MDGRHGMYMEVICVGDTVWAPEGRDGGVVDAVVYIWGSTSAQFPTCMQGPASSKQITCKLSVSCSENSVLPPVHRSPSDGRKGRSVSITVFCVPNLIGQRCLCIVLLNRIIFLVISDQWFPHRQFKFLVEVVVVKKSRKREQKIFLWVHWGRFWCESPIFESIAQVGRREQHQDDPQRRHSGLLPGVCTIVQASIFTEIELYPISVPWYSDICSPQFLTSFKIHLTGSCHWGQGLLLLQVKFAVWQPFGQSSFVITDDDGLKYVCK